MAEHQGKQAISNGGNYITSTAQELGGKEPRSQQWLEHFD